MTLSAPPDHALLGTNSAPFPVCCFYTPFFSSPSKGLSPLPACSPPPCPLPPILLAHPTPRPLFQHRRRTPEKGVDCWGLAGSSGASQANPIPPAQARGGGALGAPPCKPREFPSPPSAATARPGAPGGHCIWPGQNPDRWGVTGHREPGWGQEEGEPGVCLGAGPPGVTAVSLASQLWELGHRPPSLSLGFPVC